MQNFLNIVKTNQQMLANFSVAIVCLLLFFLFPGNNFSQYLTKSAFFLMLIPFLYIRYILKKNIFDFGFNLKNAKIGFIWGGLMLAISLLAIYALANLTDFEKQYFISPYISGNFWQFVFYELLLVNALFFFQEYFFKGLLLAILSDKIGYLSVLIQAIIYLVSLQFIYNSFWQSIPLAIFSLTGGVAAFKGRSFVYSYLPGILFIILTNAYIIYLNK